MSIIMLEKQDGEQGRTLAMSLAASQRAERDMRRGQREAGNLFRKTQAQQRHRLSNPSILAYTHMHACTLEHEHA